MISPTPQKDSFNGPSAATETGESLRRVTTHTHTHRSKLHYKTRAVLHSKRHRRRRKERNASTRRSRHIIEEKVRCAPSRVSWECERIGLASSDTSTGTVLQLRMNMKKCKCKSYATDTTTSIVNLKEHGSNSCIRSGSYTKMWRPKPAAQSATNKMQLQQTCADNDDTARGAATPKKSAQRVKRLQHHH